MQQLIVQVSFVDNTQASSNLIIVDIKDPLTPEGQQLLLEHLQNTVKTYYESIKTLGEGIY